MADNSYCHQCGSEVEREVVYCTQCGTKVEIGVPSYRVILGVQSVSEREVIESYFYSGLEYEAILRLLKKFHNIEMSMSTLKRRLKELNLKRKDREGLNMNAITEIVKKELNGPGCMFGYRSMWHTLRVKYGLFVPRNEVQVILKELDPEGTEERKRHRLKRRLYEVPGPSYCWHIDGYDKLKPYGFPIHEAIDGYSRRLWLKVGRTNNDPTITAKYYYDCVEELEGCPRLLRTDCGTENGLIATMQCSLSLRADGVDELAAEKSHRYGPSTGNQRIECFWSQLRRTRTSWWINFFKDLGDKGTFHMGDLIHMEALWFCFAELIQQDLDFFSLYWNTHHIRKSRHETVSGKPDELFFNPESKGAVNHLQPVDDVIMEELRCKCRESAESNAHQEYFSYVLLNENLSKPKHWQEAIELFQHLIAVAI